MTTNVRFCCMGCEAVHALLSAQHLTKYYELRNGPGLPAQSNPSHKETAPWLEELLSRQHTTDTLAAELDIQGIHCTGCVWLIEELFRRQTGHVQILVNPTLGRAHLQIKRAFDLASWVAEIERFGYRLGPALKSGQLASDALLPRVGICIAIALNTMIFSAAVYFGLSEKKLLTVIAYLNYGLATLSVAVGGPVFFKGALQGLRKGILHMDLPIGLGMALAWLSTSWSFALGRTQSSYFDTLSVFVALMLLGRWLQERVIEKNRLQLLDAPSLAGLKTRRLSGQRPEVISTCEVKKGDALLIVPYDVVPVDARLLSKQGYGSLDWIRGESDAQLFRQGDVLPAGMINADMTALSVRSEQDFSDSRLIPLLSNFDGPRSNPTYVRWWHQVSKYYVLIVLSAAILGAFIGWKIHADIAVALDIATAVLIVTCPCAFGIATPLAHELVYAGLRRLGFFVRHPTLIERLKDVKAIVFDKTGTLTTGELQIHAQNVLALNPEHQRILYNLCARSAHPRSRAVLTAWKHQTPLFSDAMEVREYPSLGLETVEEHCLYRLGQPSWAGGTEQVLNDQDMIFSANSQVICTLLTEESLRSHAVEEIDRLKSSGYRVFMLSGDSTARVDKLAHQLRLDANAALGGQSPEDKEQWILQHDRNDTLMIGDGVNDALAVSSAFCSGTPAIDRPFMPARTDFYFITPGLEPIAKALRVAKKLHDIVRRNLTFAVIYNLVAIAVSWAGVMRPWLAAIWMPASSLTSVLLTTWALSKRASVWK